MNLLETLLKNGQTFAVAHNKGNADMTTKLISLNVKKENVVEVNCDLALRIKDGEGKLEMSENFFNSIPTLKDVGTGIKEILHGNTLYILVCNKSRDNDFDLAPVSLANQKGDKKSLKFKNDAIFEALKITKLVENDDDNDHYFMLNPTEIPFLFKVEKTENLVKVSVPVNQVLESQVLEDKAPTGEKNDGVIMTPHGEGWKFEVTLDSETEKNSEVIPSPVADTVANTDIRISPETSDKNVEEDVEKNVEEDIFNL